MLTKGNTKLGREIYSFSIPAHKTCPGKSEVCERICYVDNYTALYPSVLTAYERNYATTLKRDFADRIIQQIDRMRKTPKAIRIHVSGDFYSSEYIRKWVKVIKQYPQIQFYAYTRSWTINRMHKALLDLGALKNMTLWLSHDKSMIGVPQKFKKFQVAFVTENYEDETPSYNLSRRINSADLVFRNTKKKVLHNLGSTKVCPLERGANVDENLTCSTCNICFGN